MVPLGVPSSASSGWPLTFGHAADQGDKGQIRAGVVADYFAKEGLTFHPARADGLTVLAPGWRLPAAATGTANTTC